jgi:Xaa-Pro aminopeptidase
MALSVADIQKALRDAGVNGWLFYDFRRSNIIAWDILSLPMETMTTRRWFYFIPGYGTPVKLVHAIEHWTLDALEGEKRIYSDWRSLHEHLRSILSGAKKIAMEYSPNADIPTVSCVDAGTIELVRSCGVDVVSSGDLVQQFQATWSDEQIKDNAIAARAMRKLVDEAFAYIGDKLRAKEKVTEYDVQQFLLRGYAANKLTADHPPMCSVNANAALPHYVPSANEHTEIKRGDVVLLDFWAKPDKPNGTYVDITWMGAADSTPDNIFGGEYLKVFNTVRDARDASLALVQNRFAKKEAVYGYEVDDAARNVIVKAGYGEFFIHRTGHSIYTEDHGRGANMDNYETRDARRILPRTSFSIEPGIYLPGKFGVRSEIDVVILPDGGISVPCSPIQKEIICVLK